MRLVILLSTLAVSFVPARAHADACAAVVEDCQSHPLHFADRSGLFDSIQFDTGFVPPDSPFQLRAAFFLGAGTHVGMGGALVALYPPAVTLTAVGDPEGGMLEIDFGFEAVLQGRIDVLDIQETFDIPIPNVPTDLRFYALEYFDPFLLGPLAVPVEVEDTIQRFTLLTIDLFDLIAPIPGFDGGLRIDAQGTLVVSYWGTRLEFEGVGDVTTEGASLLLPPHTPAGYGANRELSVIKHGVLRHQGSLVLYPTLFVTFLGEDVYEADIVSIPIPITDTMSEVEFDPSDVTLQFADVEASPLELDFGTVYVGQEVERLIRIFNHGDAPLRWTLPAAVGAFSPSRESGVISPGASVYVRVLFNPYEAGAVDERLTLETNDPDTPSITIALVGGAEGLPPIEPGDDGGVEEDAGELDIDAGDGDGGESDESRRHAYGGCGCEVASRSTVPYAEVLLVLLALVFRRRVRHRARR
jgi:hypothetical protein